MRYWPVESLRQSKPSWFIPETDEKANSNQVTTIFENLFKDCFTCVKCENLYSDAFRLDFGVREGSVLSPSCSPSI